MRTCLELYLVAALMTGCSVAGSHTDGLRATPKGLKSTKLIPRGVLSGNPDKANVLISPDGSKLSYHAEVDGVMNVWVGPTANPAAAKPVTDDKAQGVPIYGWVLDSRHVWYAQDKEGDGNWHIHVIDLKTNERRDLTPIDGVWARFQRVSYKFPNEVLIAISGRTSELYEIYRVNVETGERTLVLQDGHYTEYRADDDFNLRFASKSTPDGGAEFFKRADGGGDWTQFMRLSRDDTMNTGPVGFDKRGKILYMADSSGRDTIALVAYNLETDEKSVVASDPRVDLDRLISHPTEKTIEAAAFTYERCEWKILDDSVKADFDYLKTVADGEIRTISRTLDDKQWIVEFVMDDGPVRFYHYDRGAGKAKFLFTNHEELEGLPLAKMHPVVIKSRDGLDLVSYVSLPAWTDSDGDGRPESPLPTVLLVHGGPWARDTWSYGALTQWLANRGYAVLSVNFRGSSGFGRNFINAAKKEWGRRMHDDLIDAVNWAIKQGIAEPKRIAIMGGDYGGYAVLTGLTVTPDAFACGVTVCGPSNLITLLESIPPHWEPVVDRYTTRVGDHRTGEGRKLLTERSPLTHVDRITRPLLIAHGAHDPQVKEAEADQIVKAMEKKSIPVTYVLFADEGHGLARPENSKAFFAVAEAFLAKHLGGRYEPIGDDFDGSSINVRTGADQVPGLTEALAKVVPEGG